MEKTKQIRTSTIMSRELGQMICITCIARRERENNIYYVRECNDAQTKVEYWCKHIHLARTRACRQHEPGARATWMPCEAPLSCCRIMKLWDQPSVTQQEELILGDENRQSSHQWHQLSYILRWRIVLYDWGLTKHWHLNCQIFQLEADAVLTKICIWQMTWSYYAYAYEG